MFFYLVEPIGIEPTTIGLWARPKYKKLYHDVGASFIPTVPPSVSIRSWKVRLKSIMLKFKRMHIKCMHILWIIAP